MNTQTASQSTFKPNFAKELAIPIGYDHTVVFKWLPKTCHIFKQIEGGGNYCVAYIYDDIFSFARFFKLGDRTCCSIDFQSHSYEQMIEKVIEILEEKFGF